MRMARRSFLSALGIAAVPGAAGGAPPAVRPSAPRRGGPAADALARLLPRHHRQVEFRALPGGDGADAFRVGGRTGLITVEGTTPAVQLAGFHHYLRHTAHAHVSWAGEQTDLPARLPAPAAPYARTANVPHRFALNDTGEGYTAPYADWAWWERTIDVLALHGVNEVLVCLGSDTIHRRVFEEFGHTAQELREWVPGPAHQPWWLLQNLSGFGGPVSQQLLDARAALARRVVDRLRELGMSPVLPGWSGAVPDGFADRNPGAVVIPQGRWLGFDRPDWLDPRTGLFARVAAAFYRVQGELLGEAALYRTDLLHEGGRPGGVPVGEAARAVQEALLAARPDAVWAVLGWQSNPARELLDAVDRDRMLVLDGLSDRRPAVVDRETDWAGTPYAFGSIWNFGGHTALGANTPDWARLYHAWLAKEGSALRGIALMPEASHNNPAALALFTDLPWSEAAPDLASWFSGWSVQRYGAPDPHAAAAWDVLRRTAYGTTREDGWSEAHEGLYGARPALTAASAAAWSPRAPRYDVREFDRALTGLLAVAPKLRRSSAYRCDLLDVARQALSNRSRVLLPALRAAHAAGDRERFDRLARVWMRHMELLEALVATDGRHLLGRWAADARRWGADRAEADRLEYDAVSLLTVWGPRRAADEGRLHDYANREWSGLVGGLYALRWRTLFEELSAALAEDRGPAPVDWFALEDAWARRRHGLPAEPAGDTWRAAVRVREELARDTCQTSLTASVDGRVLGPDRPVVLTARFEDLNGFTPARDVSFSLAPPRGVTAEPLPAGPGRASWRLTAAGPAASPAPLLVPVARCTVGGAPGSVTAAVRVMTAGGVGAPHRTVSSNGAVFAQVGDRFAVEGGGRDMWGATEEFGAVVHPGGLPGRARATVRVLHQDPTGAWARAGLVVRDDLAAPGSPGFLSLALTPANGVVLSWDSDGDGRLDSRRLLAGYAAPVHLRLTRDGRRCTGECSADGRVWETVAAVTLPAAAPVQDVGIFMSAVGGGSGARGVAGFSGFSVT